MANFRFPNSTRSTSTRKGVERHSLIANSILGTWPASLIAKKVCVNHGTRQIKKNMKSIRKWMQKNFQLLFGCQNFKFPFFLLYVFASPGMHRNWCDTSECELFTLLVQVSGFFAGWQFHCTIYGVAEC